MNPTPNVDYSGLLDLHALSAWTLNRQREHATDQATYEAALAAFQTGLRAEHVEGDGRWSATRRARRVERHLKGLVKASKKAAESAEALRTSYAGHLAAVAALPGQREAKALKKAGHREAIENLAAKSLHKTAARMAPAAAGPSDVFDQEAPAAPTGTTGQQIRSVDELFRRGA